MGKSKIKPFIIAGCIILVIGLILGIYFYVTTDFLKAPKTLFLKYFSQMFSQAEPYGMKAAVDLNSYIKENNYKEIGTTNLDLLSLLSSQDSDYEYVLKTEFEKDVTNNKSKIPLTLSYKNHDLMSGEVLINNDLYGLNIDGLTEKPIAVKNENLKTLADKIGITDSDKIPNTLKKFNIENLNMTESLNTIFGKYVESLEESFEKNAYTKERNIKTTIETIEYKANRFTLYLTYEEFYNLVKDYTLKMKTDESLKGFLSEKFNISNKALEEYLDNVNLEVDNILNIHGKAEIMRINVYEKDNNFLKLELVSDNINYELYNYKDEDSAKFVYSYNNIDKTTRKTYASMKITIENTFDDTSCDVIITYNDKKKAENSEKVNSSGYIENTYRVQYTLSNVTKESADKSIVIIRNNNKLIEYRAKITIGVNAEIESLTSDNSNVLNNMSSEDLRNLVNDLTINATSFIDVSNIQEEEPEVLEIVDENNIDSALKDLNSAFVKIVANYNLDNEDAENIKDYFNQDRLINNLMFRNEILLSDDKTIVLYRNTIGETYEFILNITNYAIEVKEYNVLQDVSEITLQDILYPPPEPEPEPEPEIVPNTDVLSIMRTEIETYLAAVYNEAVTTGEEIYAADYINDEQLILNCSTIAEAYIEEQEGGNFYIECRDVDGNMFSGVIQITETGLNLLMFN